MKGANILPCPVPCAISNSPDKASEYNTRALTSVFKSLMANHSLPLTPKSEIRKGHLGSFYFSWLKPKAKKELVFSMYTWLLMENFISVWHFVHFTFLHLSALRSHKETIRQIINLVSLLYWGIHEF